MLGTFQTLGDISDGSLSASRTLVTFSVEVGLAQVCAGYQLKLISSLSSGLFCASMADSIKMTTLQEDPVIFLARVTGECPDLLYFLTTEEVKLLSKSPSDTYKLLDVNEEFLMDMACCHSVRHKSEDFESAMSKALLKPMAKNKELKVEGFEKKRKVLKEVSNYGSSRYAWV